MLLSAAMYYEHVHHHPVEIRCEPSSDIGNAQLVIDVDGRRAVCDYTDGFSIRPVANTTTYFKRSVAPDDASRVVPLGFHFNYSYRLYRLLGRPGFAARRNFVEIRRALDALQLTGGSHFSRGVAQMFTPPADNGGRVIFFTRLWEPHSRIDADEQERRRRMNQVRIELVRALRRIPNTACGIFPTELSRRLCPDLLMSARDAASRNYGTALRSADIGIANEGLKGSPGWKIGEYVAGSKAIVSNSIECVIPEFQEGVNYSLFSFAEEIADLIADLRRNKRYREQQQANWEYTRRYLHPDVYFSRILTALTQR
jgi:hypothetical protein